MKALTVFPSDVDSDGRKVLRFTPEEWAALEQKIDAVDSREKRLENGLLFVRAWFNQLEDNTEEGDPLKAIRKRYHAPVHRAIDEALGDVPITQAPSVSMAVLLDIAAALGVPTGINQAWARCQFKTKEGS